MSESMEEFEVEKIFKKRVRNGKVIIDSRQYDQYFSLKYPQFNAIFH